LFLFLLSGNTQNILLLFFLKYGKFYQKYLVL
jgi:hypothetical protein